MSNKLREALDKLMECYNRDKHLLNYDVSIARAALKEDGWVDEKEELYVWNGIEGQLDEIENFEDLKQWIKDYTEEEEGIHPDIESIIVLKKIGGITCIPVDGKEDVYSVKPYRINDPLPQPPTRK